MLDRGSGRRAWVAGRLVNQSLLETDLTQCRGSLREPVSRRGREADAGGLGERVIEVTVGQPGEHLVEPQAQHGRRMAQYLPCPVRTPAQIDRGLAGSGDFVEVGDGPPQSDINAARLGQQQLEIRA